MLSFFRRRITYHSLSWLLVATILFFVISDSSETLGKTEMLIILINIFIPILIAVYAHFYIKTRFLAERKYVHYIVAFIVIVLLSTTLLFFLERLTNSLETSFWQGFINISSVILISTGFQYFKRGLVNQYYYQELKVKNAESELQMLKSQLNPHFLFNTLNNIYAVNTITPSKGSEMILELADVMRYHLESSKRKLVSLEEEVKLIQSYIELEKLRLTKSSQLDIIIGYYQPSLHISPLLLIPFIENAFKHGTHPTKPNHMRIELRSVGKDLFFSVENTIMVDKKVVKTNVGLENTKRRLALIYPDKHELKISNNGETFKTSLKIEL